MSTITPILDSLFRFTSLMIARHRATRQTSRQEALQPALARTGLDFDRFLGQPKPGFRPFCDKNGRLDLRRLMNASAA